MEVVSVELTDKKMSPITATDIHSCEPQVCRDLHLKYLENMRRKNTNPWHSRKSIYLLVLIILLVIWLVLFVISVKLGLL